MGEELGEAVGQAQGSAGVLGEVWEGEAGAWFRQMWAEVGGDLPKALVAAAGEVAESLDAAAKDIEYNKLETLIEVAVLVFEVFVLAVMAFLSFGAAFSAAAGRIGSSRAVVRRMFEVLRDKAGASFAHRAGYASQRAFLEGWRSRGLAGVVLMAARESGNEVGIQVAAHLAQWLMGTRDDVDWVKIRGAAGGGALAVAGEPLRDALKVFTRKIDNNGVRALANVGVEGVSEWTEELLGNLGGSLAAEGKFNLDAPGLGQVAAGMVRNRVSEQARLGERFGGLARGLLGGSGVEQQMRDAQRAAEQAREAAERARGEAERAQRAADALRGQGRESGQDVPGSGGDSSRSGGVDVSERSGRGLDAAGRAQLSAETAQQQAQVSAAAAQRAALAVEAAVQSGSPQDVARAVEAAGEARTAARLAMSVASVHADVIEQSLGQAAPSGSSSSPANAGNPTSTSPTPTSTSTTPTSTSTTPTSTSTTPTSTPNNANTPNGTAPQANSPTSASTNAGTQGTLTTDTNTSTDTGPSTTSTSSPDTSNADASPNTGTPTDANTSTSQGMSPNVDPTGAATMSPGVTGSNNVTSTGRRDRPAAGNRTPDTSPAPVDVSTPENGAQTPSPESELVLAAGLTDPSGTASPSQPDTTTDTTSATPASEPAPAAPASEPVQSPSTSVQPQPEPQPTALTPPQEPSVEPTDVGQRSDAVDVQLGPAPPTPHHDPASPVDDRRLVQSLPRGRDGRYPVHPDPTGSDWISWLNDGGPFTDGRRFNCVDVAIAALSTWFGHPRVAGSNRRTAGVGRSVVEQWLGAPFGPVLQGEAGPARIEADLRALGHGAAAAVMVNYSHMSTDHMLVAVNHRDTIYWIDGQNFTSPLPQPPYAGNITRSSALLVDARGVPVTRPTTQAIPDTEVPGRLATGLDDETGPAENAGDDARPTQDVEPGARPDEPAAAPTPESDDRPVLRERMIRVNTPIQTAAVAAAITQSLVAIRSGVALAGAQVLTVERHEEGNLVVVKTPDGRTHTIQVLFDGDLLPGRVDQVRPTLLDNGSVHVRISVSPSVTPDQLANIVSARVVGAVQLLLASLPGGQFDYSASGRPSLVEQAEIAAANQAARTGDNENLIRILADNNLFADQAGSRQRVHVWRQMLSETSPQLRRRLFDTRSPASQTAVLDSLASMLRAGAQYLPSYVSNIDMRGTTGAVEIQIDDQSISLPVRVVPSGTRDFAVRLHPDPLSRSGYRLEVREDASNAAILVELVGALAHFSYQQQYPALSFIGGEVSFAARADVLRDLYRIATQPERQMIREYVGDMHAPSRAVRTMLNESLDQVDRRIWERADLSRDLAGRPLRRRLFTPHFFRRLVAVLGSGGNTAFVGDEFGRQLGSTLTSIGAGTFGNTGQAYADATLGSRLPVVPLNPNVAAVPGHNAVAPPEPSRGDPFGSNVKKRTYYAYASTGATVLIYVVSGGDLLKAIKGGTLTFFASLGQAVADKAVDPYEMTAVNQRKAMAGVEPEARRNRYAEAIYHLVNKIGQDLSPDDAELLDQMEAMLPGLRRAIEHLRTELYGKNQGTDQAVEGKIEGLRRRRSVIVQPAKTLWNKTVGRIPGVKVFQSPTMTYEMAHLPEARAPLMANPSRVGSQQSLMQTPSLYLGFNATPELLIANLLGGAGRGIGYGGGWTNLSVNQAFDAEAAAAAQALAHLEQAVARIESMVQGRPVAPQPELPEGWRGLRERERLDREAGIPREESLRAQSRKHVLGFVGAVAGASPMLFVVGIPNGSELIWIAGQAVYTVMYAFGEGAMRVVPVLTKRIDRDEQMAEQADQLPNSPTEIAEMVRKLADAVNAENELIIPTQVLEPPAPDQSLVRRSIHAIRRGLTAAGRALADDVDGWGPALRPGHNLAEVRLGAQDAVAVNRLVSVARMLEAVTATPDVNTEAAGPSRRSPMMEPPVLRGYLRDQFEQLGLLSAQVGSDRRWEAVVDDVRRRFGVDLANVTELSTLRQGYENWPAEYEADLVEAWVDGRRSRDPITYTLIEAVEQLSRDGLTTVNHDDQDRAWHVRIMPGGGARVVTDVGSFGLEISRTDLGDDSLLALVEPVSPMMALRQPHRLMLAPEVVGNPATLAQVLDQVIGGWLQSGFVDAAPLVVPKPDGQGA
ncbi:toxin glutamine deamidase domain-containing protein [Micromonospora sonneratiae]|uniref:Toxin glutamine deamidase domain-containing protein n=1 Tax=Micromonospora sonneratiae TaxID=1184706 RepID=A0ABW3YPB5_9ACTN